LNPTLRPTFNPSTPPTFRPSVTPTFQPSRPTAAPQSFLPSSAPTTARPSCKPSFSPSRSPTRAPTRVPTRLPTTAGIPTARGRSFTTAAPALSRAQHPAISKILNKQGIAAVTTVAATPSTISDQSLSKDNVVLENNSKEAANAEIKPNNEPMKFKYSENEVKYEKSKEKLIDEEKGTSNLNSMETLQNDKILSSESPQENESHRQFLSPMKKSPFSKFKDFFRHLRFPF
jgi:hypothetical protein